MFKNGDYLAPSTVPRLSVERGLPRRFRKTDHLVRRRTSWRSLGDFEEHLRKRRRCLRWARRRAWVQVSEGHRGRAPSGPVVGGPEEKTVAYRPYVVTGWIEDRFLVM